MNGCNMIENRVQSMESLSKQRGVVVLNREWSAEIALSTHHRTSSADQPKKQSPIK
ncbi:MAG: hypothetical protein ABW168_03755 [Sedimenticola sp.]